MDHNLHLRLYAAPAPPPCAAIELRRGDYLLNYEHGGSGRRQALANKGTAACRCG